MDIVAMAWEIISMDRTIQTQKQEIARLAKYEKKYNELLDSSISHGQHMMNNTLKLMLTPGVVNACKEHGTFIDKHNVKPSIDQQKTRTL